MVVDFFCKAFHLRFFRGSLLCLLLVTVQKMKFFINDFFSKSDQIRRKLWTWSHLLKKSLMENFIFLRSESFNRKILRNDSQMWVIRQSYKALRKRLAKLFWYLYCYLWTSLGDFESAFFCLFTFSFGFFVREILWIKLDDYFY